MIGDSRKTYIIKFPLKNNFPMIQKYSGLEDNKLKLNKKINH